MTSSTGGTGIFSCARQHAKAPCLCDLAPQQTLERQLIRTCMVNAEALRLIRGLGFESQFLSARTEKTVWWWLCTPPPLRPRGMFEHDELHEGARDEIEAFRKEVTTALMIGSHLMRVAVAPRPMIERIYTRDAMVPLVEGDNEFHFGLAMSRNCRTVILVGKSLIAVRIIKLAGNVSPCGRVKYRVKEEPQ